MTCDVAKDFFDGVCPKNHTCGRYGRCKKAEAKED